MENPVLSIWRPLSGTTRAKISAEGLAFEQTEGVNNVPEVVNPLILSLEEVKALKSLIRVAEIDGILK